MVRARQPVLGDVHLQHADHAAVGDGGGPHDPPYPVGAQLPAGVGGQLVDGHVLHRRSGQQAGGRRVGDLDRTPERPAQLGGRHHDPPAGPAELHERGAHRTGGRLRQLGVELQPGQSAVAGRGVLYQFGQPVEERGDIRLG